MNKLRCSATWKPIDCSFMNTSNKRWSGGGGIFLIPPIGVRLSPVRDIFGTETTHRRFPSNPFRALSFGGPSFAFPSQVAAGFAGFRMSHGRRQLKTGALALARKGLKGVTEEAALDGIERGGHLGHIGLLKDSERPVRLKLVRYIIQAFAENSALFDEMLFILPTLLTLANSARIGSVSETGANLCNEWLLVSYDDGQESNRKYGSFRYKSWPLESNRVMVMKESSKDGCVKKYTADCENGGFIQEVACPGQEPTNTSKCLGGLTCSVSSRKTDISAEEKASVYVPKKGWLLDLV